MPQCPNLTDDVHQTLVDVLYAGGSLEVAAASAGVTTAEVKHWLRRGKKTNSRGRFRRLYTDVRKAQANVELRHLASIHKRAISGEGKRVKSIQKPDGSTSTETVNEVKGDWRASAWLLSRINPKRYARNTELQRDDAIESVVVGFNPPRPPAYTPAQPTPPKTPESPKPGSAKKSTTKRASPKRATSKRKA